MPVKKKKVKYNLPTKNIWFPDQIEPAEEDPTFNSYWTREINRCMNGFALADGQVYISGWLYFHTVYWIIELDKETTNEITGKKTSFKVTDTPILRDIEWIVAGDLERAEREQKIYNLVSARGIGKSFIAGSFIGQIYTFLDDSECLITAGNNPDIAKLAEKINLGLSKLHPVLQKQRLKSNWKLEVRAGWTDTETGLDKGSNSRIIVRNYDDGNNTMATNGTRPKRQIIDEIGKIPNLIKCVLDSNPSWMNDYGFFAVPFLTGTGGDMEVGKDAGTIFNNPAVYNVLEFEDVWEGKGNIGRFIPVTQGRNEYKHPQKLSQYLGISHPDLDKIIIMVSDEQECIEKFVNPRRRNAAKSTSSNELIKEKAYYPLTPSECFLVVSANDYPVEAIKQHRDNIIKQQLKPRCIELYIDPKDGSIKHKDTDKKPVRDFPVKKETIKEGVVEVIEHPVTNAPYGLYVAGIDPYKISESEYSDSLGAVYIFKRMTDNMTETYSNMPVAWYVGRPEQIETWYETVKLLLKYYNAKGMCENIDRGFIQYMIAENETMYLAEGLSYLKEISFNSKSKATYGLPPTTDMINHWNNTSVKYTKEKIDSQIIDNKEISKLGLTKIMDIMLLEEFMKFNRNDGNFDRQRAFSIAVAYARQLDSTMNKIKITEQETNEYTSKTLRFSPFFQKSIGGVSGIKSPFFSSTRSFR